MRAPTLDRWLAATREALFFALLTTASLACDAPNLTGTGRPVPAFDLISPRQVQVASALTWIFRHAL